MLLRRVSSPEAFKNLVEFLRRDVEASGGSAGEAINMFGTVRIIRVCKVPWGTILVNEETDYFGAWAWFLQDEE